MSAIKNDEVVKMNLQLFAEDDDGEVVVPDGGTNKAAEKVVEKVVVTGKTFSADYVADLRAEAKENRIGKKNAEALLREALGVGDDVELTKDAVVAFKKKQSDELGALIAQANDRLLSAEIKGMVGYDTKLLERLIDKTKLEIQTDGTVKGLEEAVKAVEAEFPQVKLAPGGVGGGTNPDKKEPLMGVEALQAQYEEAVKSGNLVAQIALKNKIFEAQNQ